MKSIKESFLPYAIFEFHERENIKKEGKLETKPRYFDKSSYYKDCQNQSQQMLYVNKLNTLPPSLSRHLDTHHRDISIARCAEISKFSSG